MKGWPGLGPFPLAKVAKVVVEYRHVLQAPQVWRCTKHSFVGKVGAARHGLRDVGVRCVVGLASARWKSMVRNVANFGGE